MLSDRQVSALDATLSLAEAFEKNVSKHPFILAHPTLLARCNAIGDLLGQLYQEVGCIDDQAKRNAGE